MSPFEQAVSTLRYLMTFFRFLKFPHLIFWITLKSFLEKYFLNCLFSLLLVWIQILNCSPSKVSFGFKYSALLRLLLIFSVRTLLLTCTRFFIAAYWFMLMMCLIRSWNFRFFYSWAANWLKVFCWMKDNFMSFHVKKMMLVRNAMV